MLVYGVSVPTGVGTPRTVGDGVGVEVGTFGAGGLGVGVGSGFTVASLQSVTCAPVAVYRGNAGGVVDGATALVERGKVAQLL